MSKFYKIVGNVSAFAKAFSAEISAMAHVVLRGFLIPLTMLWALTASAQDTTDAGLDSLLRVYQVQEDDTLKVNTLTVLYNKFLYNEPGKAKEFAIEQLKLSQQLGFESGIARSLYFIGVYYNNIDQVDSARAYYHQSVERYNSIKDVSGKARVNNALAILEYYAGDYDRALEILDTNIQFYQSSFRDSSDLAMSLSLKGLINVTQGNHKIALSDALKSLALFEKVDYQPGHADALGLLANIELQLENFEKSIEYNTRAKDIYNKLNDKYYASQALNDIGLAHFHLDDYPAAIEHFEQSIVLSREINNLSLEGTALTNLGKVYRNERKFDQALSYLNQSLVIVAESQHTNKIVEALMEIGGAYNEMKQPRKALDYLDRSIHLADSIGVKESSRIGYFNRSIAHELTKNYQASLEDYKQFKAISDSIFNATKSQQIEELRTIYDTEKKEQQIVQQKTEIALLEQQEKVSSLQKTFLGTGLGLLLLAAGLGFYGLQQKIKKDKLAKEKVEIELAYKTKELTTQALHLARKNETLENLKQKVNELKASETGQKGYRQLISVINFDLQDDNSWENFARCFNGVHKDFYTDVAKKYPEITPNELRLMSLLKMNLSSKEIANILNISIPGVKKARQRLRKKMNLSTQDSLENAVLSI